MNFNLIPLVLSDIIMRSFIQLWNKGFTAQVRAVHF